MFYLVLISDKYHSITIFITTDFCLAHININFVEKNKRKLYKNFFKDFYEKMIMI